MRKGATGYSLIASLSKPFVYASLPTCYEFNLSNSSDSMFWRQSFMITVNLLGGQGVLQKLISDPILQLKTILINNKFSHLYLWMLWKYVENPCGRQWGCVSCSNQQVTHQPHHLQVKSNDLVSRNSRKMLTSSSENPSLAKSPASPLFPSARDSTTRSIT